MKGFFVPVILASALSVQAATTPHGNDRLRELVVFPEIKLTFSFGVHFQVGELVINNYDDPTVEITGLREELKRQPENAEQLLQLGNLLEDNGETGESARHCSQSMRCLIPQPKWM